MTGTRQIPQRRLAPSGDTVRDGAETSESAGRRGPPPHGPRVHVWRASRIIPLPGALALMIIVPVLLAVGVATIGLFAAGMAGLLSAPRLLRRRGSAERGRDGAGRPTIVLERGEYRRVDGD